MAKRLEIFATENFPLVEPGDFLPRLILDSLDTEQISFRQGDVLVLAQKIVSKSESRYANLNDVEPSGTAMKMALRCDKDAAQCLQFSKRPKG